jgi:hypothetical protein
VEASKSPHIEDPAKRPEVAFILGMGRSGTNFLLDLLDLSERTHCRNEPDELPGGSLAPWSQWKIHSSRREGLSHWEDLSRAVSCGGDRDRPTPPWKSWLRQYSSVPAQALSKSALRKLLPGLGSAEFRWPHSLVRQEALASSLHIFKINAAPSVAELFLQESAHSHDRSPRIIHIVRNPAGFLRSWRRRWLAKHDDAEVLQSNRARIQEVLANDPDGGAFMAAIDEPDVFESELLFWRYCTQRIREAGRDNERYIEVSYDELASSPIDSLQGIFKGLDLPWTQEVNERVVQMTASSVAIASAFQAELDEESRAMLERTLGEALFAEFELTAR